MAGSLSPEIGVRDDMNVCQLCGTLENLSLCGGCRHIWYCCKAHQREDWKAHKKTCKKIKLTVARDASSSEVSDRVEKAVMHNKKTPKDNIIIMQKQPLTDADAVAKLSSVNLNSDLTEIGATQLTPEVHNDTEDSPQLNRKCDNTDVYKNKKKNDDLASNSHLHRNDSNFKPNSSSNCNNSVKLKNTNRKNPSGLRSNQHKYEKRGNFPDGFIPDRYYLDPSTHKIALPSSLREAVSRQAPDNKDNALSQSKQCKEQYLSVLDTRFEQLAKYVVDSLLKHGICVIDKFLGETTGQEIFNEVILLEKDGIMKQGQLVHGTTSTSNTYIRGDVITWVDGTEKKTENIHFLISCMDAVVMKCTTRLNQNTIDERTKAMVACYPGKKTGYVRHVDNPSGDGRCITCIYYLNKDWDVRVHGGLLRIYPEGEERVANIEPLFDRLLFFWSDRRNPHEVEEAFKERYAITVWYYDAKERAEALKHFKGRPDSNSAKSHQTPLSNEDCGSK